MRRALLLIALTTVVLLCGGPEPARAQGLRYFGSDPYKALAQARVQRKMLLVEFYAAWNHRSRWMSERVLGDTSLRELIEEHFLVVRVDTDTEEGAGLAQLYEVTGYPTLVIFSSSGDALDKIDRTLDREDFRQRIEALLLVSGGAGLSNRRLEQVYAAAEAGDRRMADIFAAQYLASQTPEQVVNRVIWPLFQNTMVTYYGSAALGYLLDHVADFRHQVGGQQVDRVIERALLDGMLPYVVGTAAYDGRLTEDMLRVAERQGLVTAQAALRPMAAAAAARAEQDWAVYVGQIAVALDLVPPSMQFPLLVALEPVAAAGAGLSGSPGMTSGAHSGAHSGASQGVRAAARRLVTQALAQERSPSEAALLGDLLERLK